MSSGAVILVAAGVGLLVNTLAVLGIAWRGGRLLGHMDGTLERLSDGLEMLKDHPAVLARVVNQLDNLERRVERLENRE